MIESKPIDNNDICKAIINLNKETIVVAAIIENQSIVNFLFSNSQNENENINRNFKNNDNNSLRNILSDSSKFLIDISNNNTIKSKYLLLKTEDDFSFLVIPLTINDTPNRILAVIYVTRTNVKDESILIDKIIKYSKNIR